jgi:hypothetical protein
MNDEQEAAHIAAMRTALHWYNEYAKSARYSNTTGLPMSQDEANEIEWCEKLFSLEDKR